MNWAALAAIILAQIAPNTKNKVDDRIAQALGLLLQSAQENAGKPLSWQVTYGALAILKPIFERTDWSGDEKLRTEAEGALRSLETVLGKDYFRNQVADIEKLWPYLLAPGVPAGIPVAENVVTDQEL